MLGRRTLILLFILLIGAVLTYNALYTSGRSTSQEACTPDHATAALRLEVEDVKRQLLLARSEVLGLRDACPAFPAFARQALESAVNWAEGRPESLQPAALPSRLSTSGDGTPLISAGPLPPAAGDLPMPEPSWTTAGTPTTTPTAPSAAADLPSWRVARHPQPALATEIIDAPNAYGGGCRCGNCVCDWAGDRMGYDPLDPAKQRARDMSDYNQQCERFSVTKKDYVIQWPNSWIPDQVWHPVHHCKCGLRCRYINNPSGRVVDAASAVVTPKAATYYRPRPDMVVATFGMEPPIHDKVSCCDADWSMTYRLSDAVPTTYFEFDTDPKTERLAHKDVPRSTEYVALALVSHCSNNSLPRTRIIEELQKYISVRVLGDGPCVAVLNSTHPERAHPECPNHKGWRVVKKCLMARYKFYLAFENSQSQDYVSEKLEWTFEAGTLPVYWGAPNAKDYVPGENSALFVNDFPTVKALADRMQFLFDNPAEYAKYFEWVDKPYLQSWLRIRELSWDTMFCRFCERLSELDREKELRADS